MSFGGSVATAVMAVWLAACTIDVSLEGKQCPCLEGWDCVNDECVRSVCEPTITVSALSPTWATAHDVHWTWEPNGAADRFLRYELWIAQTEQDLASRSGTARMFGAADNPELGTYVVPVAGDVVMATITRGLESGTPHYAQLVVLDVDQCPHATDVVARTTAPEPQNSITLFADALPAGAEMAPEPPALQLTTDGDVHLEYHALEDEDCVPADANLEDVKATCGQPLRVRGFSADVAHDPGNPTLVRLTNGLFVDAYLEMRVQIEAPIPSYYSTVWLANGATCLPFEVETSIFRYEGFTLPNGPAGVTVEVPLSALAFESTPLTYSALDPQAGGTPLCGFAVNGTWHKTGIVRVDDVKLRF